MARDNIKKITMRPNWGKKLYYYYFDNIILVYYYNTTTFTTTTSTTSTSTTGGKFVFHLNFSDSPFYLILIV